MSSFVIADPTTELEEIAQNIRTILATPISTVPLDRGFGVLGLGLDDPLPAVQASMTRDILDAITKFEPRAEVVKVSFTHNNETGKLAPSVIFRLKQGGQTANVRI
ncbi:MAG: GPW/gp25 family protein [Armatimonadota bacterium]